MTARPNMSTRSLRLAHRDDGRCHRGGRKRKGAPPFDGIASPGPTLMSCSGMERKLLDRSGLRDRKSNGQTTDRSNSGLNPTGVNKVLSTISARRENSREV